MDIHEYRIAAKDGAGCWDYSPWFPTKEQARAWAVSQRFPISTWWWVEER